MSTIIPRPGKKFVSANSNSYIKVAVGGSVKNVMLDAETLKDWDSIKTIEVDMVDYDHSMLPNDEPGKPTGPSFSRAEVIDYQTFGREITVKQHDVALQSIERKMLKETVVTSDEVAKLMEEAV